MRPVWLMIGLMGLGLPAADAQPGKFPYEAIVDVEEDFARCGPGPKYYPTSKLRRGDRVVVHRHDPGGWAMVAPPADSFSWIQSEYVQKAASGRGALTSNNVIVHVGSNLGDERSVYQRMLSKGDTVEVLGEQTFVTERGPSRMYKIKPPPREYRWVAGKSLLPADGRKPPAPPARIDGPNKPIPFIQGPIAQDLETEVAEESSVFEPSPFGPSIAATEVSVRTADDPAMTAPDTAADSPVDGGSVDGGSLEELRQQLALLDQQFRATLQNEPQTWDLASLKSSYTALEQAAQHPAFTSHVNQRLSTLQRYAKIQTDYVDFYRLTTETQQRDAKLLSLQKQNETQLNQPNPAVDGTPRRDMGNPGPAMNQQPTSSPYDAAGQPQPLSTSPSATPAPINAAPSVGTPVPGAGQPPQAPKFSGAGIVQRSSIPAPGVPPYMLVTPDGRLLAYLEPAPGIDLTRAQNQALGIIGERAFREELKTDVIMVRGFQPVVLRTILR